MNRLEQNAVRELKKIIKQVEEGQFNIQSVGTQTIINETNILTDAGPIQNRTLRFEIEHTFYPEDKDMEGIENEQ
ncbi:hypothetical protein AALF85_02595 [Jeotgalicoccus halotolerans]|uniref:hypothetical protein n=1 Tax=Jeotgalicoccus halotolerans TaxID=157227 RepID=UPI0035121F48